MTEIPGFVLVGAVRTKKTGQQIITIPAKGSTRCRTCNKAHGPEYCQECGQSASGFPKIIPSKAHGEWHAEAMRQCENIKPQLVREGVELPITALVNVKALFYQDADRADAVGLYESLADLLQDAGIIKNDKQIVSWEGSLPLVDRGGPRVEVYMTVLRAMPVTRELVFDDGF